MHEIEQKYAGFVLSEREENRYDDSHFHVTVWDWQAGRVSEITYASTAWASTPMSLEYVNRLVAMTPPHIKALAADWIKRNAAIQQLNYLATCVARPDVLGATVEVYKGRKVAKGTRGKVISLTEQTVRVSRYGTFKTTRTMALLDAGDSYPLVDIENCKLLERSPRLMQEIFDLSC